MAPTYYDFEKLKEINPNKGYQSWLDTFSRPKEDNWIEDLVNYCKKKT